MAYNLATKTMNAIEIGIMNDQGAAFRTLQGQVMPHMGDAFRGADDGYREHLGASQIGKECARNLWYGFRWTRKGNFSGRMLRLFNRGHLEEARFIAMLLSIGVQVYQQDEHGKQFRIKDCGGHFGGSGDGVGIGIPDLNPGVPCLLEFKTHGEKSFLKLQKQGVQIAKPEHFVQTQTYMTKMNLDWTLYGAVNKNTDELHMEIIRRDGITGPQYIERARQIIYMRQVPERIHDASPGYFTCRYCDSLDICWEGAKPDTNCRTCHHVIPNDDGTWACMNALSHRCGANLSKVEQLSACNHYTPF